MEAGILDVLAILGVVALIGLTRWAWSRAAQRGAAKALFRGRGVSDPDHLVEKLTSRDWDHYDGRPE